MKPPKLITIVAVSCSLAIASALASPPEPGIGSTTNDVTFTAVMYQPGSVTANKTDTESIYTIDKKMYNTADLLGEISSAFSTSFSTAAKLVLIETPTNFLKPTFAVIDGTKFYDLSPAGTNIMTLTLNDYNIQEGTISTTGSTDLKTTQIQEISLYYDDTAFNSSTNLHLNMQGLGTIDQLHTATNSAGFYTQTLKIRITSMTGTGISGNSSGTNAIVMTGLMSISGKGLVSPP